jgi:exonuclease III
MDVNIAVWNVRGLNQRARRSAVRELVASECVSLLCLQETKLVVVPGNRSNRTGSHRFCEPWLYPLLHA